MKSTVAVVGAGVGETTKLTIDVLSFGGGAESNHIAHAMLPCVGKTHIRTFPNIASNKVEDVKLDRNTSTS